MGRVQGAVIMVDDGDVVRTGRTTRRWVTACLINAGVKAADGATFRRGLDFEKSVRVAGRRGHALSCLAVLWSTKDGLSLRRGARFGDATSHGLWAMMTRFRTYMIAAI
jgi:hypothetical protein